jgi:hypothetical protein
MKALTTCATKHDPSAADILRAVGGTFYGHARATYVYKEEKRLSFVPEGRFFENSLEK